MKLGKKSIIAIVVAAVRGIISPIPKREYGELK